MQPVKRAVEQQRAHLEITGAGDEGNDLAAA
jgi:hypothetical protein